MAIGDILPEEYGNKQIGVYAIELQRGGLLTLGGLRVLHSQEAASQPAAAPWSPAENILTTWPRDAKAISRCRGA